MNAWLSDEWFDDPTSGSHNFYRLHKVNEFKPWHAVFWEGADTNVKTSYNDPSNKPDDKPSVAMNRHAQVNMVGSTVSGGGQACFAFLDGHCEVWRADNYKMARPRRNNPTGCHLSGPDPTSVPRPGTVGSMASAVARTLISRLMLS